MPIGHYQKNYIMPIHQHHNKSEESRPVGDSSHQEPASQQSSVQFEDNRPEAFQLRQLRDASSQQSATSFIDNRPEAIVQRQLQANMKSGQAIEMAHPGLVKTPGKQLIRETEPMVQRRQNIMLPPQGEGVVQMLIEGYKPGTLRKDYIVMRGLTAKQRAYVQMLHDDDEDNVFSVEDARAEAIEERPGAGDELEEEEMELEEEEEEALNPYSWDVMKQAAFTSADVIIQSIVKNFGHPTQAVTKIYMDLGDRIGKEVNGKPSAALSKGLVTEIYQVLDAQIPLHFGENPFLTSAWQGNLKAYKGGKKEKQLYAVLRTKLTKDLVGIKDSVGDFNKILHAVSGRPPEAHHFLFKAIYGKEATMHLNLGLVERSPREKDYGPGQHELMHYIASGASKDKFKVLTNQFTQVYNQWVKDRYGQWLLKPLK